MKRLITFFFVALSLLLACDKPAAHKIVIPIPEKPTGQQGGNNGNNGNTDPGTTPDTPTPAPTGTVIVGYAVYWEETIPDPALLTHINYAFALINNDFETLDIKKEGRLKVMVALKKQNPKLKVLLSVGGWGAGNFSEMAADEKHRKAFAKNCANAVTRYSLDGIDIDWEYPTKKDAGISASDADTQNFTLLMKDLREALGQDKLLTMASASNAEYVNFKECVQYMDFVNVMTYDMGHAPHHNAALYDSDRADEDCDGSVGKHIAAGVPANKIVLGIPFYGHGEKGEGHAFEESVDYKEIAIDGSRFSVQWDATAMVPYVVDATGKMVLSYDNARSVGLKAEYVLQKGLAGAMYWNIEADDDCFTLGNAVASRLLPGYVAPAEDPNAVLVTDSHVQKYLQEVNYPNTNNPDTDAEYNTTRITDYPGGGPGEADISPKHTIRWTANASAGALDLIVWEGDWGWKYSLPAGTSSYDLSNLVPGRTYHYQVTSSSGKTVGQGSFKTRGLLHQVYFEPRGRNGRDLGGWKGLGGKTLAYRKLFRGGAIHGSRTNDKGKAEMRAQGIKAEVDLREADDVPSKSPLGSDIAFFAPGFDEGYNEMIKRNKPKVKETFCFVVQCLRENKPVYFHCAAGRDRTGTLAVLLEGALGVSESDMAKDYELTYFSPEDWSMSTDKEGNSYYGHVRTTYSYKSIRKTIFEETDSGTYQERIVKYLLQIGVPQKDIDDLRSIMLE